MLTFWKREAAFLLGNHALAHGDLDRARSVFSRALERSADAGLCLRLAAVEEERGASADAEELLGRARELEPRNPATFVLTGVFYAMQGRFEEALPYLDSVLARDATQPLALSAKGSALLGRGEREEGLKLLAQSLGNASGRFQSAFLCFSEQAVLEAEGVARLVESLVLPGENLRDSAKPPLATRVESWVIDRLRRVLPGQSEASRECKTAERLLEGRRYGEAEAALRAAAAKKPSDDDVRMLLGYATLLGGKPKKTLADLKEKGSDSPAAERLKGLAEMILSRLESSQESLSRAAQSSNDFLDYYLLAVNHLLQNDKPAARRQFSRALTLAPDGWVSDRLRVYERALSPSAGAERSEANWGSQ